MAGMHVAIRRSMVVLSLFSLPACGDEAQGGGEVLLRDLNESELEALCNDQVDVLRDDEEASRALVCAFLAPVIATYDEASGYYDEDFDSLCEAAFDECLHGEGEVEITLEYQGCGWNPSRTCTATVDEYLVCADAILEGYAAWLEDAACVEDISAGPQDVPEACAVIEQKCPEALR